MHVTVEFVKDSKLSTIASTPASPFPEGDSAMHSLRDAPVVMSPPDACEPPDEVVVVVVGGVVVVVVGGVVVVVVVEPPPPPPPLVPPPPPLVPPPPPPPAAGAAAVVVVVVVVVGTTVDTVVQRFTSPENWLLLDSEASVKTTSVRTAFESLPPNADAEASMLTIATSTLHPTASVMSLGIRCAVFARKKFLSEPLYMEYKFAVSNHTPAYEVSTVRQFTRKTLVCTELWPIKHQLQP
jgi:hypothetical protein